MAYLALTTTVWLELFQYHMHQQTAFVQFVLGRAAVVSCDKLVDIRACAISVPRISAVPVFASQP